MNPTGERTAMFRTLDDALAAHEVVAAGTLKILRALDDAALTCTAAEGHRTLGGVAWHIVTTLPEMMLRTGLPLSTLDSETPPPDTVAEIVESYEAVSAELVGALREQWQDADLTTTDEMYGETWPRGQTLSILLHHEIHHRGQMTVLMRQAGLKVPGVFGPAKEEWSRFGMPEPPY